MGLIGSLIDKYKQARQHSANKKEFKEALLRAVADGKLTKEEIDELEQAKRELGLSNEDVGRLRADVYLAAFAAAKADRQVTKEEEEELGQIQKYLGIADQEIARTKQELSRLRLLNEIQKGNLPEVLVTNVVLQKGEKGYWSEAGTLVEERVISRRYEGGSSGMSFRIMKGVSYRVGAHRGHIVAETGMVDVSAGELIITNKRLIFRGDRKSFAAKLNKILDIQFYSDGLKISEENKAKPKLIKFIREGNQDIVGAILSQAVNSFGESR